jgi:hypothetical protein
VAIQLESFLGLEESLSRRLWVTWKNDNKALFEAMFAAVKKDNYVEAQEIIQQIDFSSAVEKNKKYCQLIGVQSVLFGAQLVTPIKQTQFYNKPLPKEVVQAAQVLHIDLANNATAGVIASLLRLVSAIEEDTKESKVKKAEDGFIKKLVSFVDKTGESYINIASSLHNSRLSQFGFLAEAELTDVYNYAINEQLDGKTCPVCRLMHGEVFTVEKAREKVDSWLAIENPEDFKHIAPWPKQSKQALIDMGKMTKAELQAKGWDTPPFHPLCRGLLKTSVESYQSDQTLVAQPINPSLVNPFS